MKNLRCELKQTLDNSYTIEIGQGLVNILMNDICEGAFGKIKNFAVITDSNVMELYGMKIFEAIKNAGFRVEIFAFNAGELSKTRETKSLIEDSMLSCGFRRDCMVIAVGGGVVSDLAGFIAGTYGRGVPFVIYSTTLLSGADASVGGKVAVDTHLATNQIGLFYQPKKVYIDLATWRTLPVRQMKSGLAETIKHACIADYNFFEYLEENLEKVFEFDGAVCEEIAQRNCEIKYSVVMNDEREKGMREILNLGHTVGRAIETTSGYRLLHGEALSIGLTAQLYLGIKRGYISQENADRVITLLKKAGLAIEIPDYINRDELFDKLYTDKKVRDGKLRFVFQKEIGGIMEFGDSYADYVDSEEIKAVLDNM